MLTDPQLACLAVTSGPCLIGLVWVLGNLVPIGSEQGPSPARVARLCLGLPLFFAIWLAGAAIEAVAILLDLMLDQAERSVLRLRDWMEA